MASALPVFQMQKKKNQTQQQRQKRKQFVRELFQQVALWPQLRVKTLWENHTEKFAVLVQPWPIHL